MIHLHPVSDPPTGSPDSPGVVSILGAARIAQGRWAAEAVGARVAILRRARSLLAERAEQLAATVRVPQRTGVAETLTAEVLPLAEACRFLERRAKGLLAPRRVARRLSPLWLAGTRSIVRREPHGVVLVIGPANYPLMLPGIQALQALTAGNAVVLKPGRGGRHSARLLGELLRDAGLPDRLYNVLDESAASAQACIAAGVDKILLTGMADTGRAVLRSAAETLTPATAELSGCDAVFVREEADMEFVARALRFGMLLNGGATCIAPRRVFVASRRLPELERVLAIELHRAAPVRVDTETRMRTKRLVDEAEARGARVVVRGANGPAGIGPIVLSDATPDMAVMAADVFAPLLSLVSVRDEAEALRLAARCPYALGAAIFGDERPARELAAGVDAGVVVINDMIVPTADPALPFGGRAESGFGVTRGAEGLLALTRPKVEIRRGGRRRPHFEPLARGSTALATSYLRAAHLGSWRRRLGALRELIENSMRLARTMRQGEKR